MKNVNIAELKNKLSAYLDQVEQGEEIIVKNRDKAVAKIVPLETANISEQERNLVAQGILRLPEREITKKFLNSFLAIKMPEVLNGSSVEALLQDRNED